MSFLPFSFALFRPSISHIITYVYIYIFIAKMGLMRISLGFSLFSQRVTCSLAMLDVLATCLGTMIRYFTNGKQLKQHNATPGKWHNEQKQTSKKLYEQYWTMNMFDTINMEGQKWEKKNMNMFENVKLEMKPWTPKSQIQIEKTSKKDENKHPS